MAQKVQDLNYVGADTLVLITCHGQKRVLKVCSQPMALASPIWAKFISPPWTVVSQASSDTSCTTLSDDEKTEVDLVEDGDIKFDLSSDYKTNIDLSKDDGIKIDFTEDDGAAVLLLLNAAHLKYASVPKVLAYKDLFNVAILCDQYQCVQLVRPWLESWLKDELTEAFRPGREGWLFIAWVFGREDVLEILASKLVVSIRLHNGECINQNNHIINGPMPSGIMESILQTRLQMVKALLDIPYYNIEYGARRAGICHHNSVACEALICGSLIQDLDRRCLWPMQKPEQIDMSIEELACKIRSLSVLEYPSRDGEESHEACSWFNFWHRVTEVMNSANCPVLDAHYVHMRLQRGEGVEGGIVSQQSNLKRLRMEDD